MTTGQIVTLYPHKSAKQIWSLVEKESISDCRATTWTRVSVFIQSRAESNPATSKVTTDAAEVFSNDEVAFFCTLPHDCSWYKRGRIHLLLHVPAKAATASMISLDVSRTLCLNLIIIVGYLVMKSMKKWQRKEQLHARKNNAWNFAGKQRMTQRKK